MTPIRDWLKQKDWGITDLRAAINVKLEAHGHEPVEYEVVRRWTLAPGDKLHRIPGRLAMAALLELAQGAFDANVFYPPLASPPESSVSQETLHGGA